MTRINTTLNGTNFTHDMLLDQHLFVAYREVTRISSLARVAHDAPAEYVLGTGHMKFFFDKGAFLVKQCAELYQACVERGYNATEKHYKPHGPGLDNDWQPDFKATCANLMRLQERLNDNPGFYTYKGKPASKNYYYDILISLVKAKENNLK